MSEKERGRERAREREREMERERSDQMQSIDHHISKLEFSTMW